MFILILRFMLKKLFILINFYYLLVILFLKNLNYKWCINLLIFILKINLLYLFFIFRDIKYYFLSFIVYEKL